VTVSAYHGTTTAVIDLSPYKKFNSSGSQSTKPWIHVVSQSALFNVLNRLFGELLVCLILTVIIALSYYSFCGVMFCLVHSNA